MTSDQAPISSAAGGPLSRSGPGSGQARWRTPSIVRSIGRLSLEAIKEWSADGAATHGAAVAFYTIFSIAPLLLLVIALAGLFFSHEVAQAAVLAEVKGLMGAEASRAIEHIVITAQKTGEGIVATIISLVLLGVGATSVLAELQSALNQIWKAKPLEISSVRAWLRARLLSLSLIGAAGFLLSVSLVLSAALTAAQGWISFYLHGFAFLIEAMNLVVSYGLTALFFASVYKILPDVPLQWRDVIVGSLVTALLFNIGKYAISVYVTASEMASGYGAAGALIVVFVWVFYSTQIFLLGAEFTKLYAATHGSRRGRPVPSRR